MVVTPNRRLARALAREFDAWQIEQGRSIWETPRVLPFGAFVAGLHESAQHDPALTGIRVPLSAAQELALWEAVIDASGVALASPAGAAELAAEAWALAHRWQIADRIRHYALTEDTRLFAGWAADYERRVERIGSTDQARLPDGVRVLVTEGRLAAPAEVLLAGFDELTPQQDALFKAIAARGTQMERLVDERSRARCERVAAVDGRDELERMADWAAGRLAANPHVRIGIVVPDLAARRRAITRALDAALMPGDLLAPPDRRRPYTVSLGGSLAATPLVAAALRALRLAVGAIDFAEASALLRSPHLDFGPAAARARFDVEWRRRSGRTTSLQHLLAAARSMRGDAPPAPRAALEALNNWRERVGARSRRLTEWAVQLMEALRTVGFPGTAMLDSVEYQTLARWQELMTEFAGLERVQGPVDLRGAVRRLARLASSTVFQSEGGDPPVQVVGLLEANGLEFDHLWITGMTSEGWPPSTRAHPLLPFDLQRAKRMPGAVVELELQRAQATLDRLARSSAEVVASHAASEGDRALAPTPMIAPWRCAAAPAPRAPRALDVIASARLETITDAFAPGLPATRVVGGGVATLTDQSACPFRAFARHRLAANEPEQPHDGLAPSERGELVHRVLAGFWVSLPERTKSFVGDMSIGDRTAALEQAADRAIARLRERRLEGLGKGLLALEKRRLVNLALQWLQFELDSRGEFEVKWTEERRTLAIGSLSLTGQIDRVDRLPDGRTIVIDYKTGGPSSAKAWLGARPDEPQLPLYLVASEPDARGIAFARLRAGERRFVSLVEDDAMLPNARVDDWRREYPTWSALVQAWEGELTRLADDFASGAAQVAPKRADTCRYCEMATLCRFSERAGEVADETSEESGDE